jgi:cytochrome c oxidase cbb3-type subunit 3
MRSSLTYAGAVALALLLFRLAHAADELKNPYAGDAAAAVEGKRLFLKTGCYACHGHEAEGAVGPDLTDDEWIYKPTDAMIFNTIAKGRPGTVMAPFGDQLTPDEIWKIVEFLRDKNRQRHLKDQ